MRCQSSMTGAINQAGQIRSLTMLSADTPPTCPSGAALTVSLEDLRPLRLTASEAGISWSDILRSIDLPPDALDQSQVTSVSLADYFRIIERLSIAAHDETCGLSTRPLLPGATNLVLSNLANCTTLFEAMKAVANAYNLLHGGAYNRVELHEDCLAYVIDDSAFPYASHTNSAHVCFTMECVLIFLHGMLTLITGDGLHGLLKKVHTKRAQPGGQRGYLDFWPAPIRWAAREFALYYDLTAMSIPIAHDHPAPSWQMLYRKVIDLIERRQGQVARKRSVFGQVSEAFDEGLYDQVMIAKRLGLSVATLRRRLQDEGKPGFRTLRESKLNQAAKSLLARRHHPGDVADELGFGDMRSFARAFKRWNGSTPAAYLAQAVTHQSATTQAAAPPSNVRESPSRCLPARR